MSKRPHGAAFQRNFGSQPFSDAVKKACFRCYTRGEDKKSRMVLEDIAQKLVDMALEGDLGAIREISHRIDGRPAAVQVTNNTQINIGAAIAEVLSRRKVDELPQIGSEGARKLVHADSEEDGRGTTGEALYVDPEAS